MAREYALAFSVAAVLAVVTVPVLGRVAIASGLVNHPTGRKFSARSVPYLGGIALGAGALVGALVGRGGTASAVDLGIVAVAAVAVALVGLADDAWNLGPWVRVGAQTGAAIAVVLADLRVEVTGVDAIDVALTILWVVGVTNAFNFVDNIDGLAGGLGTASAGAVFALAAFGEQELVAAVAVALTGACLGFLAWNARPAAVYLGDAGALFCGFVLAVLALDLRPVPGPPTSVLVPLLLVAVPVADMLTVVVGRLRHGRNVASGGTDHLSHRLVRLGLGPGIAVALLVGLQLAFGTVAVFVGRDVLAGWWAAGALVVGVGGLWVATAPAHVYEEPAVGLPRGLVVAALAVVGLTALLATPATLAAARTRTDAEAGRRAVERALDAAGRGDVEQARAEFALARDAFAAASDRLDSPLVGVGLAIPVLAPNLRSARELAQVGEELSEAGLRLASGTDPERLKVVDGQVPLAEIAAVRPDLEEAARLVHAAEARVDGLDRTFLVGPVRDAIDELDERLTEASDDATTAVAAAEQLPAIFGGKGPRRYFLAIQNSAELRATGGFIGNWGVLAAEAGDVRLEQLERVDVLNGGEVRELRAPPDYLARYERFGVANTWQNVNMAPDLPTVGQVVLELFPQSPGGSPVDGVIAVDPPGLAALLTLTGPVAVEGWPEPITADNVVDVTLRDAYVAFDDREERADFLGEVARSVWDAVTEADLGSPEDIGAALTDAAHGGHLAVYLADPAAQALVERVHAAASLPPVRTDALLAVTQNAAGNKADYYLRRSLRYTAEVAPDDDAAFARVTGRASLTLTNGMPGAGLPTIVAGPYDERFAEGENRAFVTLYTPLLFESANLDGAPVPLESAEELGRNAYSTFVSIPSGASRTLTVDLVGELRLQPDGWYVLDLGHQPTLWPDTLDLDLAAAPGWRIAEGEGCTLRDGRAACRIELDRPQTVRLRLEPGARSLWDRLGG